MAVVKLIIIGGAIYDKTRIHIPKPEDILHLVVMYESRGITLQIVLIDPAHPTVHDAEFFASPEYQQYVTIVPDEFSNYQDAHEIPDYSVIFDFTGVREYSEFISHHNISLERIFHLFPCGCHGDELNYPQFIEPLVCCPPGLYANFNLTVKDEIDKMIHSITELKEMFDDIIPSLTDDIRHNYQVLQDYFGMIIQISDTIFEYHRFNEFVSYIRDFYKDCSPEYEDTLQHYNKIFAKLYNTTYVSLRDTSATINGLHTSGRILSWYYGNFKSMNGVEDKYVPIFVVFMTEFCRQHSLFSSLDIESILTEVILQDGSRNEFIKIHSPFIENQ